MSTTGSITGSDETAAAGHERDPRRREPLPPYAEGPAPASPGAPVVTVVMPAYNRADLIGASLDSALAQTYRDFELLVVDDGSTDGTAAIVRAYADRDRRVRLLAGPHRGMSGAMNVGVRAARGRYYARLDSDDLWDPRFLAATVAVLDASPRVGVVYPRARTFSTRSRVAQPDRGRPMTFPDRHFESMLLGDHASGAALVRVACHQQVGGYDETLSLWEDWDFWLRTSRHYDFHFVDEVLAYLRVHPGNVSAAGSADRWRSRVEVLDRAFAGCHGAEPGARIEALRAEAYRNVYFDVGHAYWGEHDFTGAWAWFREGLAVSGHPAQAARRLAYTLLLHQLGQVPHFWTLHGVLSRARRALASARAAPPSPAVPAVTGRAARHPPARS